MTTPIEIGHRGDMSAVHADSPGAKKLRNQLSQPALLRAYFLAKLPLAAIAGLSISRLDDKVCEVKVPFGWRTKNPFGSMYFAAQTMAAELACAGLALTAARGGPEEVSVLPVGLTGRFEKRAIDDVTFTCADGEPLYAAVDRTLATGEGVTCDAHAIGMMRDGTIVSQFTFTWSFKKRAAKR
ncbi:DUF4442 domain-containing protein [Myxococcota bacterium]|nr:DUF4442 domain-containing protein [Myxococcota bacterium]